MSTPVRNIRGTCLARFLNTLHSHLGDLCWYSLMIFVACRSGDIIQAFIGLWLVPKYVGPDELGAVLPLQQLSTFLTIPLAIITVVFSKFVNTYATRGEYGKVKCFIRDVLIVSLSLFALCIVIAYLTAPFFYECLHVASGSLTLLILLCGLVTNLGSLASSAQQGLKRFKTMSIMILLSAPIRLVTLLIAMPYRALSGYILGQTTPVATTTAFSILDVHRTLKPYSIDTSWRRDLPEIFKYILPVAVYTLISAVTATASSTVYRQRLPEIESAAYYLLSRFAEISGYIGCSLLAVLTPLASEAHEKGEDGRSLLKKAIALNFLSSVLFTLLFCLSSDFILSLNTEWQRYSAYARMLPILAFNVGMGSISSAVVSYEIACRRFFIPIFFIGFHAVATVVFIVLANPSMASCKWPSIGLANSGFVTFNSLSVYCWFSTLVTLLAMIFAVTKEFSQSIKTNHR